ncbi:protein kes1 [Diplogelasinospora grovesii]|uniref:Protein kes1 n=1 Tax=Diplogelasinospora grovesii TaxID=303347 RepID=A0AAN6N0J2_9PEZI|nr:protein kes1 [Diplogelasinospora grovesii]
MDGKSVQSRLRDLVKFLSTVQGDLSNVTGPPSLLAPSSVVEVGHCWGQRPAVFAAPSLEPCPEKRALLVLRFFLTALRSQLYVGGSPKVSIKKPINAFLGELFFASWTDSDHKSTTRLVAEQVSHHPPITAMHISDSEHGVRADGYARVEMTFNGAVNVRQLGHAVYQIDRYRESYLIPLPDVKVRGFLSGCTYPEIIGTYTIFSTSGYTAEITFSGEGVFRGKRNSFQARIFQRDDPRRQSIYEASGVWSDGWTVRHAQTGDIIENYIVDAPENEPAPIDIPPIDEQDPWESRRAWGGVLSGMEMGDMRMVVTEKTKIEQAQRQMRTREKERNEKWEPLLFKSLDGDDHEVFHDLTEGTDWRLQDDKTKGVWRIDEHRVNNLQRPFRGHLTPLG